MPAPPSDHTPKAHTGAARAMLWTLLAWLSLEGLLHGWASGVDGDMPAWMTQGFSLGRSVLAYLWWRFDRQQHWAPPRLWLSGLLIALPWLGSLMHLWLTRRGQGRWRSLLRHLGFLLALGLGYVLAGGLMAYALGGW